ncbi:hypothetical protein CTA1_7349 [Colletotrichum tanaceti]|uniref:Uncharacterized protein n=1 Tax=Colletotrichum tanaceti TaxID=1306861 RepID=A0A4U6XE76_9PEZI|nr:hypothetical protein CTA1_7349 [Colletotrichum tanaceti]
MNCVELHAIHNLYLTPPFPFDSSLFRTPRKFVQGRDAIVFVLAFLNPIYIVALAMNGFAIVHV